MSTQLYTTISYFILWLCLFLFSLFILDIYIIHPKLDILTKYNFLSRLILLFMGFLDFIFLFKLLMAYIFNDEITLRKYMMLTSFFFIIIFVPLEIYSHMDYEDYISLTPYSFPFWELFKASLFLYLLNFDSRNNDLKIKYIKINKIFTNICISYLVVQHFIAVVSLIFRETFDEIALYFFSIYSYIYINLFLVNSPLVLFFLLFTLRWFFKNHSKQNTIEIKF